MSSRIGRSQLYLSIAALISQRSTCNRLKVGAVIVKDVRIVSMGYTGAAAGQPHCDDVNCNKDKSCLRTIHAEQNAIAYAARSGIAVDGAVMFITHSPCIHCAKLMWNAGIREFVYAYEYRDTSGLEFFRRVEGKIFKVDIDNTIRLSYNN